MKKLIVDIDNTLCTTIDSDYKNSSPIYSVISKLQEYKDLGFTVVLFSSRNMRTYGSNIGKINIHTLPVIIEWLNRHNVPYDEVLIGKPWCGHDGFYIDDRAIRPSEFIKLSYDEIKLILSNELNLI
jgi:capsule biosynthesis phosphatase